MKRLEKVFIALCAVAAVQAISVADAHANPARTLLQQLDTNPSLTCQASYACSCQLCRSGLCPLTNSSELFLAS